MLGMRSDRELLIQGVCNKIEAQFPEEPYAKLLFAIIQQSILDITNQTTYKSRLKNLEVKRDRRDAIRFLNGNIHWLNLLGIEIEWIRNGEPIIFEGEKWYPADGVETLLDSEVMLMGSNRKIQFFIYKVDVRPFERLYTKFGKNRFRYWEREEND